MNKKGSFIICALMLIAIIGFVSAQTTNPWSADATGKEKNSFLPSDSVYVSSYTVCFGANNFSLYIINAVNLTSGLRLDDVRGQAQEVKTNAQGFIPVTKIWSNISSGNYSIVLDCNNNGRYDTNEPVDGVNSAGFSVGVIGTGTADKAADSPSDFTFSYDSEAGIKEVGMMHLILGADKENVNITSIELQANGTGDDAKDIEKVVAYSGDRNQILGTGVFTSDNGKAVIALNGLPIMEGMTGGILIDYVMRNFTEGKTYSFSLITISAVGDGSNQKIAFAGLPIYSALETIGKTRTCSGQAEIDLSSSTVFTNSQITANVSGIQNCSATSYVKLISCNNNISLCQLNNAGGTCTFASPSTSGSYTVLACIDKNGDGVYNGTGEAGAALLAVVQAQETIPANNTVNNASSITGNTVNTISNGTSQPLMNFDVITVLSVGMIIIFVILVIILIMLFKLAAKK